MLVENITIKPEIEWSQMHEADALELMLFLPVSCEFGSSGFIESTQ